MNVLLLSMPDSFEHMASVTTRMPNGALSSLAGNVDEQHTVAVADLILAQRNVRETVTALLDQHRPDVVGLSVMTFQRPTARKIVDLVRERRPSASVVVGGYDPSLAPEAWTDVADVIVRGEGEITFRELLRAIEQGRSPEGIAGLWWRRDDAWVREPGFPGSGTGFGWVDDRTLRDLYANCRGYLFPGEEDFGIAPVEAQAAGKPVIAYAAGGALDTVIDGETGVHFARQTPTDLADAVRRLESLTFDPERIRQNAQRFSAQVFRERFSAFVERAFSEWRANLASESVPHT